MKNLNRTSSVGIVELLCIVDQAETMACGTRAQTRDCMSSKDDSPRSNHRCATQSYYNSQMPTCNGTASEQESVVVNKRQGMGRCLDKHDDYIVKDSKQIENQSPNHSQINYSRHNALLTLLCCCDFTQISHDILK